MLTRKKKKKNKNQLITVFVFNYFTLLGFKSAETLKFPVPFPLLGSHKLVVKMHSEQQLISANGHYTNEQSLILFYLFMSI